MSHLTARQPSVGRRLAGAVCDRDLVAGVGERAGDGEADAPVASGDENRAAQRITLSIAVEHLSEQLVTGGFPENLSVRPRRRTFGHRQWLTDRPVGSLQSADCGDRLSASGPGESVGSREQTGMIHCDTTLTGLTTDKERPLMAHEIDRSLPGAAPARPRRRRARPRACAGRRARGLPVRAGAQRVLAAAGRQAVRVVGHHRPRLRGAGGARRHLGLRLRRRSDAWTPPRRSPRRPSPWPSCPRR